VNKVELEGSLRCEQHKNLREMQHGLPKDLFPVCQPPPRI
jgi:hypothetical protein